MNDMGDEGSHVKCYGICQSGPSSIRIEFLIVGYFCREWYA